MLGGVSRTRHGHSQALRAARGAPFVHGRCFADTPRPFAGFARGARGVICAWAQYGHFLAWYRLRFCLEEGQLRKGLDTLVHPASQNLPWPLKSRELKATLSNASNFSVEDGMFDEVAGSNVGRKSSSILQVGRPQKKIFQDHFFLPGRLFCVPPGGVREADGGKRF